jgi:hypothetical protein
MERIPRSEEEGHWEIEEGQAVTREPSDTYTADGYERLTYNNPYNLEIERVWFDGKVVYAVEQGEIDVPIESIKVAQEYQVVYAVELDETGKLKGEPERVDGQYNIYDSVPGMEKYSPLWQFNYVIVPRDYEPNTLRSEQDCLASGYEIRQSTVVEN